MDGEVTNKSGTSDPRGSKGRIILAETFLIPEISREDLLARLIEILHNAGVAMEELFWYRLAIDEALINAITHGHLEDPDSPRKPVRVDCRLDGTSVEIKVSDEGFGFDPECVPDPTLDENLWNITGRGIFLMKEAMDDVTFNDIGNSVLLVRNIKRNGTSNKNNAGQIPPNT